MIKVFILNIRELEYHREKNLLSKGQLERVEKCKAKEEALRKLAGSLLLQYVNALPIAKQPLEGRRVDFVEISLQDIRNEVTGGIELPTTYGEFGKPILEKSPWQFNISHSGDYAVIAWSLEAVGVDIQKKREVDYDSFGNRFFTKEERESFWGIDKEEKQNSFFQIWCRKEAYGKLKGVGLKEEVLKFSTLGETEEIRFTEYDALEGYCLSVCTYKNN